MGFNAFGLTFHLNCTVVLDQQWKHKPAEFKQVHSTILADLMTSESTDCFSPYHALISFV